MTTNQETETETVQHCEQCGLKLVGQVETFLGYCFSCIENETGLKEIQVSFSDPKKQTAAKAYLHYIFLKQQEIKDVDLREFIESTFEVDGGLIVFHMVQVGFIRPSDDFRTSRNYIVQNPPKPVRTWPPASLEDEEVDVEKEEDVEEVEDVKEAKEGAAEDEASETGEESFSSPVTEDLPGSVDPKTGIKLYEWQKPYAHLFWNKVRVTRKKGDHCSGELLGARKMNGPYVFPFKGLVLKSGKSGRLFKIPLEEVVKVELIGHEEIEPLIAKDDVRVDNEKTKSASRAIETAGKKYQCGSCPKSFESVQKLAAHSIKEHRFNVEEFKKLVKEGKTEEEISSIMKRSIPTISYHWRKLLAEGAISRENELKQGPAPAKVEGITCPHCWSKDIRKTGLSHNKSGDVQVYRCRTCKRRFIPGSHYSDRKKSRPVSEEKAAVPARPDGTGMAKIEERPNVPGTLETKDHEFREVTRIALSEDPGYRIRVAILDSIGYDLKSGDNPIKALSYTVLENHTSRKISLEIEVKTEEAEGR